MHNVFNFYTLKKAISKAVRFREFRDKEKWSYVSETQV